MFSKVVGLLKSSLIASEQVDSYSQLDFIGDVHAHYNELVGLLKKMDYEYSNGVWQHPQKKAVFVGDFVNRGPSTLKVLELVKSMVENNKGYALLGNHELNLIGYFTLRKNGSPIAKLTPTHQAQMEQIKYQFENEEELQRYIKWLKKLPFFIDFGSTRAVHAYWGKSNKAVVDSTLATNELDKKLIKEIFKENSEFSKSVWQTTKGIEINLPKDLIVKDSKNIRRTNFRIKWWEDPKDKTFRTIGFGNRFQLPKYTIPKEIILPFDVYSPKEPIVFFGHYCLGNDPLIIMDNICCLDSCVAGNSRKLTAYRWTGEKKLNPEHLVQFVKQIIV